MWFSHMISRLAGCFVSWKLPKAWVRLEIDFFARIFKVDLSEVKNPLESFNSLQAFFIRDLKDGCRPINHDSKLVSPCDGAYGQSGDIEKGEILQVKGQAYSVARLVGDDKLITSGTYATIYLSPRDYHCFHAPMAGRVVSATYIPGYLWPVNAWAVKNIKDLFCVNERMVIVLQAGEDQVVMVAVGATMVGKVKVMFDADMTTNMREQKIIRKDYGQAGMCFEKGDKIGHFEFGSTIVMLSNLTISSSPVGTPVQMGQKICV